MQSILDTASALSKITDIKNTYGIDRIYEMSEAVKGLEKEQAILALTTAKVSKEDSIAVLKKAELITIEEADAMATNADTASKYANLKVTNLLKVAWSQFTAFAKANPWLVAIVAAVGSIALIAKGIDLVTTSTEEHREKLNSLKDEYSNVTSELDSLNTELQTTESRIKELESKGTLTFTEKEEYDNLVKQNNELQRSIDLLELEQKTKNAQLNKAFVDTMKSDVQDNWEYMTNDNSGKVSKGNASLASGVSGQLYSMTDETAYINQQFDEYEKLSQKYDELMAEFTTASDERKAQIKEETDAIKTQMDDITTYLSSKNTEWTNDASGISYISNPDTDDEKAVNEWLDFIADFQDKMAIMQNGDNAKENTFNRLVDNWQFDETVQGLQDLGKQGKVTAEMLNALEYDAFIQKLIELGVIDSAENLDDIALAFNNFADSVEDTTESLEDTEASFSDIFSLEDAENTLSTLGQLSEEIDTIIHKNFYDIIYLI